MDTEARKVRDSTEDEIGVQKISNPSSTAVPSHTPPAKHVPVYEEGNIVHS
jgi:hypothetical protein